MYKVFFPKPFTQFPHVTITLQRKTLHIFYKQKKGTDRMDNDLRDITMTREAKFTVGKI